MQITSLLVVTFAAFGASNSSVFTTVDTDLLIISAMETSLPRFSLPWDKFEVPSLSELGRVTAKQIRKRIYGYVKIYSALLLKHLSSETEVLIQHGRFDDESGRVLSKLEFELGILQYRDHLQDILKEWSDIIGGQPLLQAVHDKIIVMKSDIVSEFEEYIYKLQAIVIKNRHFKDNLLCKNVCKSRYGILNLSSINIPSELEEYLANGSNFVPNSAMPINELKSLIEKDLVDAAIGYFRDKNKI